MTKREEKKMNKKGNEEITQAYYSLHVHRHKMTKTDIEIQIQK